MGFEDFFKKIGIKGSNKTSKERASKDEAPSHWVKCPSCNAIVYYKEVLGQNNVCPKCAYHFKITAQERIELLSDEFIECDKNLAPIDPLNFVDKKSYKKVCGPPRKTVYLWRGKDSKYWRPACCV